MPLKARVIATVKCLKDVSKMFEKITLILY